MSLRKIIWGPLEARQDFWGRGLLAPTRLLLK